MLYEQLLREKEEKEEILDNYNYEKEKFEQIIDLLQSEKYSQSKLERAGADLDKNMHKRRNDDSSNLEQIPFQINSNSKDDALNSPSIDQQAFYSPRGKTQKNKSNLNSPVEYYGKVVGDIKLMKDELSKMQNNIKNLMFSPERSTRNPESAYTIEKSTVPELTLNDLTSDNDEKRRKHKKHKKVKKY